MSGWESWRWFADQGGKQHLRGARAHRVAGTAAVGEARTDPSARAGMMCDGLRNLSTVIKDADARLTFGLDSARMNGPRKNPHRYPDLPRNS